MILCIPKELIEMVTFCILTGAQTVWVSDGDYTIYAIIVSDTDSSANENDTEDIEKKIQSSGIKLLY